MKSRISTSAFSGICGVGIVFGVAWVTGGFLCEIHVCADCGMMKETRHIVWIPFSEVRHTSLSLAFNPNDDRGSHQWMFAEGMAIDGGRSRGRTGKGRHLLHAINSRETAAAMEAIKQNRDQTAVMRWMSRLLDPGKSRITSTILLPIGESPENFEAVYPALEEDYDSFYPSSP